jgi:nucleoside-diphosphate-sugar epimerase
MAHGLIHRFAESGTVDVVALDVRPLDPEVTRRCAVSLTGDIRDRRLLERLRSEFEIHAIYHLAAILSTRAEFVPETAHDVNVGGTLNLLQLAVEEARWHGHRVRFLFPSSIAVYGLPDVEAKRKAGPVAEDAWTLPITMYGCNKLYGEHLGRYYKPTPRAARRRGGGARRRLPRDPLARAHLRVHDAQRGDERLRARDAPRRRAGTPVCMLRP